MSLNLSLYDHDPALSVGIGVFLTYDTAQAVNYIFGHSDIIYAYLGTDDGLRRRCGV